MRERLVVAVLAGVLEVVVGALPVAAQSPAMSSVERASELLDEGRYADARKWARITLRFHVDTSDAGEAHRIIGIASFYLKDVQTAESAFFDYLRADAGAHLDPARYPPEVIVFFEDVRTRRAAELTALRPRTTRRQFALNFLPPAGQFQNGQSAKGWAIAGIGAVLLVSNIASYAVIRRWCESSDSTCPGHHDDATRLRELNILTGAAFAAVYAYGVVDGVVTHRRLERETRETRETILGASVMSGGAQFTLTGRF